MKKLMMIMSLTVCCLMGGTLAGIAGIAPLWGAAGASAIGLLGNITGSTSALRAGLLTEVWTGITIKKLVEAEESYGWLNRIRSYDQYAENDVIHLVNLGISPDVLFNNTTYPIPVQALDDVDNVVSLDKLQTKATIITDDELKYLSYEKLPTVLDRHKESLTLQKIRKACHALAPARNSDLTPVLRTTGEMDDERGKRRLRVADIIAMKKQFDLQKVPLEGRILILCPDHVADLLLEDRNFHTQYNNYTSGKIANLYGFEVYEYVDCPYYTSNRLEKLAFNAIPADSDSMASVVFYAPQAFKATGTTKMYYDEASGNPLMQESTVSFRHYFITLPLKNEALGAIISGVN